MKLKERIGLSALVTIWLGPLLWKSYRLNGDSITSMGCGIILGIFALLMIFVWTVNDERLNNMADYLAKRHRERQEKRQVMRMLRDDDNPRRITRRRHQVELLDKVKMYAFFVSVFILAPIAGLILGIWKMQYDKSTGGLIVIIVLGGTAQIWLTAVGSALKQEGEKQ